MGDQGFVPVDEEVFPTEVDGDSVASQQSETLDGDDLFMVDESTVEGEPSEAEATEESTEEQEAAPESDELSEGEEAPDKGEAKKGSRAQERIRSLANEKKELKTQVDHYAQAMQQMQYQMYQLQEHMKQQALQAERGHSEKLEKRLEAILAEKEFEKLTPEERVKREFIKEVVGEVSKVQEARFGTLEQKQAQREREIQAAREAAQTRERLNRFDEESNAAVKELLKEGYLEEDAAKLSAPMKDFVMTFSGAIERPPQEAQMEVKKFLDNYYNARLRGTRAKLEKAKADGKQVPKTPSGQRRAKTPAEAAHRKYTAEEIAKMGYKDPLAGWTDNWSRASKLKQK